MRISDWSSDVCSSDLPARGKAAGADGRALVAAGRRDPAPLRQGTRRGARPGYRGRLHAYGLRRSTGGYFGGGRGAGGHAGLRCWVCGPILLLPIGDGEVAALSADGEIGRAHV